MKYVHIRLPSHAHALAHVQVCGADGREYPSRCLADCTGVTVVRDGPCHGRSPDDGKPADGGDKGDDEKGRGDDGDKGHGGGGDSGGDKGHGGSGDDDEGCICTAQYDPVSVVGRLLKRGGWSLVVWEREVGMQKEWMPSTL